MEIPVPIAMIFMGDGRFIAEDGCTMRIELPNPLSGISSDSPNVWVLRNAAGGAIDYDPFQSMLLLRGGYGKPVTLEQHLNKQLEIGNDQVPLKPIW